MSITAIARPEIRALRSYDAETTLDDALRLNANEAPQAPGNGAANGLNRYPAPRPLGLAAKLAALYEVDPENILVTRGSSEGIDLLVRAFCRHGLDDALVTPPVFSLYRIYASVQGAGVVEVPLLDDFELDPDALLAACDERTKLIFLCSPNNPTGSMIPRDEILRIVKSRSGKSVVVVDEAYIEFSDTESLAPQVSQFENLVVLRTLSKALALAGARCGSVIASPAVIALLDAVLAPYAISAPVISSAESALSARQLAAAESQVRQTIAERERLSVELAGCKAVERVWPSQANFLLVRFSDLASVKRHLDAAGIAIRSFEGDQVLQDCARITIASQDDNDRLLRAIRGLTC